MALCGMECIVLTDDVIKNLGIYFSDQKKPLKQDKNFLNHIVKIQNIFKLWKLRNLTIERTIVVSTSLAISKLIHNDYEYAGLENVDIFFKTSWIKSLFGNNFHRWKLTPLCLSHSI